MLRTLPLFRQVEEKIICYYGERTAQLEVDQGMQTLLDTSGPWWFTLMNRVLLYSPHVYVKRLKKIWVDKQVNYQYWSKFIEELQDDWQASITPVGFSCERNIVNSADNVSRRQSSLRRTLGS